MSNRKTALLIVAGLAVAAVLVAAIATRGPIEPSPAVAQAGDPPDDKRWQVVAPGRVEPRGGEVKVGTPTPGVVDEVLIKANDTVFAGEPMIFLHSEEAQARLASAQGQVAMRLRARTEQTASRSTEERRRTEDAVAGAEQAVFDAQLAVDKAAAGWRLGGEPDANLTAARSALARAQDDLKKRSAELRKIDADGPAATIPEAQLRTARADLAAARIALDKMTIRAPVDGTVLQVNVIAGELATAATPVPLVQLGNLTALRVRAEVDERDLREVKVGQPVLVRATAFPGKEFPGKVASIAKLVEPGRLENRSRGNRSDVDAIEVMVDLAQPGPLAVGMKVDVYFQPDRQKLTEK